MDIKFILIPDLIVHVLVSFPRFFSKWYKVLSIFSAKNLSWSRLLLFDNSFYIMLKISIKLFMSCAGKSVLLTIYRGRR